MPPVALMAALCDAHPGITLDFLYRGVFDGVPIRLARDLGDALVAVAEAAGRDPGQDPGQDPPAT